MDPFAKAPIGRTKVRVPRLGLGTAPLGGWPAEVPDEQGIATVQAAWDKGVRYFDTAPFYGFGSSERRLGEVLSSQPRDEFTLSTKVGRLLVPEKMDQDFYKGADPYTPVFDFSYDGVMRSLEESLRRLKLDRADIVLIHDPDDHHDEALSGAFKALDALRTDGTIGAVGVGMNWSEPLTRFAREADFDCFLVAGRYTLLEQDSLDNLMPAVEERGMSIIAGGVYNSGVLADPDRQAYYNYTPAPDEIVDKAKAIKRVCDDFGVPLRAAALQFPLSHPAVATVAIGSRTPDEVDDNVTLLSTEIPAGLWETLREQGLIRAEAPTSEGGS
jgi:D-threo-aldose 1-dehydrogenase